MQYCLSGTHSSPFLDDVEASSAIVAGNPLILRAYCKLPRSLLQRFALVSGSHSFFLPQRLILVSQREFLCSLALCESVIRCIDL
uniref:Uncharacterized protein n=1 Tax=Cucumis sativus TaxID=3659 RepID=A0A0A0LRS3_CUCSA